MLINDYIYKYVSSHIPETYKTEDEVIFEISEIIKDIDIDIDNISYDQFISLICCYHQ